MTALNAQENAEYKIQKLSTLEIADNTPLTDLEPWKKVPLREIKSGDIQVAKVGAAHDGKNLFLVYLVNDDSPLKNRGQDPYNHYKEGDNCDVMIGPFRSPAGAVSEGDMRILFTPVEPAVVTLYRQMMKGSDPDFQVEFKSPVRTIMMDFVAPMEGLDIAFKLMDGGYSCVVKIPFEKMGIQYQSGTKILFDLGVLSSNDGGIVTERRAYLFNKKANVVMDVPTEAELTPAEWGLAVLE